MASSRAAASPRIVSLAPSVTSILVALGARRNLIGVSLWCADVTDVRALPRLDVPAIHNSRVIVVRDEWLNTPGPPLMQGAAALLGAIHPELAGPQMTRTKINLDGRSC